MNYEAIKNYGRIIKLYFQFLCEHGFSIKQYDILNSGEYFVLNSFSLNIKICITKSLSNFWGSYQNVREPFFVKVPLESRMVLFLCSITDYYYFWININKSLNNYYYISN